MKELLKSSILLLCIGLLLFACKKDDDDNSSGGGGESQTEYLNVTKSGTVYTDGSATIATLDGAVEYTSVYSQSPFTAAELAFASIPSVGSYSANLERGFSFAKGSDAWFSTSSTTITIAVHDHSTNYVKGTVSGTMQNLLGTQTTTSVSAQFGFFY